MVQLTRLISGIVMVNRPKVLCVAEKNDAAKSISRILAQMSNSVVTTREGRSVYNKLYCLESNYRNGRADIVFTSVSGHLKQHDYSQEYRSWHDVRDLSVLFNAPIVKFVPEEMRAVEMTLKEQARGSIALIIWTDCDREGENIGGEVVDTCLEANARINVFRARFSEITNAAISRAMNNLVRLHQPTVDAVDCRSELDLRIGAAFTRLQTLHLQRSFPGAIERGKVVSYGSCQFPTLGFVVERYKEIQEFVTELFWKLAGADRTNKIDFLWDRVRLFDEEVVKAFHEMCQEGRVAKVVMVDKHPKSKWRPVAMDTIALEKLGIRFLRMSARQVMDTAERLYARGIISYPRTETDIFPKELALAPYVQAQTAAGTGWEQFAGEVLNRGPNPRNGRKTDQAHPPIHPLKAVSRQDLTADEWKIYELVVRHFLACLSWDARGQETKVKVEIGGEGFMATGLIIEDMGYMRVYPYEKWVSKALPNYQLHQVIPNFVVTISSGRTEPPRLLTEDELIALMDKHGIGTDATHAEHIERIQVRDYVNKNRENRFEPKLLGLVLVDAYNCMGHNMVKPTLRANLEAGLVDICNGRRNKQEVLQEQISKYRRIFIRTEDQINVLSATYRRYRDGGGVPGAAANNANNLVRAR